MPSDKGILTRWIGACCVLLLLLWAAIGAEVRGDRQRTHDSSLRHVQMLAESHAEQLDKMVEQIDLMSSTLVFMKEAGALPAALDDQFRLVAHNTPIFVAFIDAQGVIRNSRYAANLGSEIGTHPVIEQHRNNDDRGLHIQPRARGLGTLAGMEVVRFTRRVNHKDGSFAGVLTITLPHAYLHSYQASNQSFDGDFSSVWLQDGPMLTNWTAGRGDRILQHYIKPPQLDGLAGARLEPRENFIENQANYVGWRKLERYPLVALSAMTEANAMAELRPTHRTYLLVGVVASLILFGGALLGARTHLSYARRQRRMAQIQNTFRLAVDKSQEVFFMLEPVYGTRGEAASFRIEDASANAGRLTGLERHALIGKRLARALSVDDAARLNVFLQTVLRDGYAEEELVLFAQPGMAPRRFNARAIRSADGIALTMHDVTELRDREEEVASMAHTDLLTGLPNRAWLVDYLPYALGGADSSTAKVALIFIDIHDFKRINDSYGQQVGDRMLVAFGKCLMSALRKDDRVIRIGGDKFAILVTGLRNAGEADIVIEQVREKLKHIELDSDLPSFAAHECMGVAVYPDDAQDAAGLINAADIAMYDAKAAGKSATIHYSHAMSEVMQAKFRIERDLRRALECGELVLFFQPRVLAATGALSSFEALIRWQDPERGLVPPGEFIPVAEESGLIVEIGNWVVEETCRLLAAWREQDLALVPVSVNVSAQQLTTSGFREHLTAAMADYRIEPALLAIELTEATMVGDDPVIRHELQELRRLGIELHIDDFGTGYSSLSQLQKLDVDTIKIDQSFVRQLGTSAQGKALCEAIVQMCRALDFTTVAEGVETRDELAALQDMGCIEIQGYLFSRPVPADRAMAMLVEPEFAIAPVGPATV